MCRFGHRWLLFCLLFRRVLLQNSTVNWTVVPSPPHNYSDIYGGVGGCDPDPSFYLEASNYFVVSSNCQLLINMRRPIEVQEVEKVEKEVASSLNCNVHLPSVFPVASDELGVVVRQGTDLYAFVLMNVAGNGNTTHHNLEDMEKIDMSLPEGSNFTRKSCHLDRKRRIIRCLKLDVENRQKLVKIVDYEGVGRTQVRIFEEKTWPLPASVNVKKAELLLSYYDEFTESNRIWMEHNLQWFYNVNMEEQERRGNKSTRLTTYHLSNKDMDRQLVVPVYSDSSGMVTAHCTDDRYSNCRYIYNRVDAKSAMEGTCILELPYLTTVGIVVPSRHMTIDNPFGPGGPQALVKERRGEGAQQPAETAFIPIYILVITTFVLVVTMMVVHFIPSGTEDLTEFYRKIEDDYTSWGKGYIKWKKERAEARAELKQKKEEAETALRKAAEVPSKSPPLPRILKGVSSLLPSPQMAKADPVFRI